MDYHNMSLYVLTSSRYSIRLKLSSILCNEIIFCILKRIKSISYATTGSAGAAAVMNGESIYYAKQ